MISSAKLIENVMVEQLREMTEFQAYNEGQGYVVREGNVFVLVREMAGAVAERLGL